MWRQLVAYNDRIRNGGLPVLADVVALRATLDMIIDAGIADVRSNRWSASWAEIGEATGMARQSAQKRWGSLGGARRVGGQPSHLR
jgi:hypothetical protein